MPTTTLTPQRTAGPVTVPSPRTTSPAHRHATPTAAGMGRTNAGALRMVEPASVTVWNQLIAETPQVPDASTVQAMTALVRSGASLSTVARKSGLPAHVVADLVLDLGSRCSQMNKRGPKIKSVTRASTIKTKAVVTRVEDTITVAASAGWCGEDGTSDIRRAYAALLVSDGTTAMNSLSRWEQVNHAAVQVTYTHVADLYSAARGLLPDLHLVIDNPVAARAYVRAWQMLDDSVHAAMLAVRHLTSGRATADSVRRAVRASYWLLAQPAHLDRLALAVNSAPTPAARLSAESAMHHALGQLRRTIEYRPRRYMPRTLSDLTSVQVRAIAAGHGLHVADGSHARSARSLDGFAADVEEARSRMQAELLGA